MTFEKEYLLKLDLQLFSDDDNTEPPTDGETDLQNAIRSLLDSENQDDDNDADDEDDIDDSDNIDEDDSEDDELDDEELEDDEDEDDSEPEPKTKKQQSKEDNAKFARERREREAQARAQAELDRLKKEAPEFQLAQMLSEQFGKPVEEIMAEIKEQQIQQQAKTTGRSVDDIRREQAQADKVSQLEQELNIMKFNQWDAQIKADTARLSTEYKMLTDDDFESAKDYILKNNVNMPLEDAIYAVHGKKIVQGLAKGKEQDELATKSGRKVPPSPRKSTSKKVTTLSADEKAIARAFGMTDDEYDKYKS